MNKKFFYGMMAATMLFATSCQQDDVLVQGGEATISFQVSTPEIATRAFSDGNTATDLTYVVYTTEGVVIKEGTTDFDNRQAQVQVQLAKGNTYNVLFWADAPTSPYTVNAAGQTLEVNYNGVNCNDENLDAFYSWETIKVSASGVENVELKRPFAQLNIGTADLDEAAAANLAINAIETQVVVELPTTMNFASGKVGQTTQVVTFAYESLPARTEVFPVDDAQYDYLAMNYLLVGADKTTADVKFSYKVDANVQTRDFNNIPVQRNYRTNIYGNLLTETTQFNVEIKPAYENNSNNVDVWDGKTVTTPVADANGVYRIKTAAEFVGMMNDSKYPNCNKYQNVVLDINIDFDGYTISGFGDASGFFDGIFDGQDHIVSNFKIDATNRTYYAGLFNQVSQYSGENTVIKNLIVENAEVAGSGQVGVIAGGANGNTVVENCKVYNSTLRAVKKVGSIIGYTAGGTVRNNYAENCKVYYSEKEAGEILGYQNTGSTVSGNTFSNVVVSIYANAVGTESAPKQLEEVMQNINTNPSVEALVNIPAGSYVSWTTGSGHGSTPFITADNNVTEIVTIQGAGESSVLKVSGSGVGSLRAANGAKLVFKDITIIDESQSYNEAAWELTYLEFAGNLEFRNVVFNGGITLQKEDNEADLNALFVNCTFNTVEESVYGVWVSDGTSTFDNCKFRGTRGLKMHEDYGSEIAEVMIDACEFGPLSKKPGVVIGDLNANTKVTIQNSTFIGCQAGDQGKYIYETDTDVSTFTFVEKNNAKEEDPANVVKIGTKEELIAFQKAVNVDGNGFAGKTIQLTANIDLGGMTWEPIGQTGGNGVKTYFQGAFDGKNYTISNFTVTPNATYGQGKNYAAGLFGFVDAGSAVITNLNIDGATINGHHWTAAIAGYLTGTIQNCNVTNTRVVCTHVNDDACGDKAGTIVGYINEGSVKNCTADKCQVEAGRDAGQIVGASKAIYVEGCTATNVTVSAVGGCTGANVRNEIIGRVL